MKAKQLDLFIDFRGLAIHKASESVVIVIGASWYKSELNYDVVVPLENEKGATEYFNATYTEKELKILT